MKSIADRILEISYKNGLSHIGSCLTALPIIEEIFKLKKQDEKFVLSCGHAALALYCVLEAYGGKNAEEIFKHHGVHPDFCRDCGLDCSTGSLGNGLPIAVGMALADRSKICYAIISDGECSEGSIWESLRIAEEQGLNNLKVYLNFNSWGAYKFIDTDYIFNQIEVHNSFSKCKVNIRVQKELRIPWLLEQEAHYKVLDEKEYKKCLEILKGDSLEEKKHQNILKNASVSDVLKKHGIKGKNGIKRLKKK